VKTAVAAFISCAPTLADAVPLPEAEAIALPSERLLLERLHSLAATKQPAEALKTFDAMLIELREPTEFRGLVQYFRAMLLHQQGRGAEAADSISEGVRLLPKYSAPLLQASQIYAFNDRVAPATDYLVRASRIDPSIVNVLSDYEISNMLARLREANNQGREIALSERLLEVGWSGGRFPTTSRMALLVLEQRLKEGKPAAASAMVPKIIVPSMLARLRIEEQFAAIRPASEAWAGARLEKAWPLYLEQAREEWEATKDLEAGKAYVTALAEAGHDTTLVETFLPLFYDRAVAERDVDLIFIASPLASALARLGRWDEADKMFARALTVWPAGGSAITLNLTANRGRFLVLKGDFAAGMAQLHSAIEEAGRWGGEVNQGALASMHLYRACALEQLGRSSEAARSERIVAARRTLSPTTFAYLQLCKNDLATARQALLDGLEMESTRSSVLMWMQPEETKPPQSEWGATIAARSKMLKEDATLRVAAGKHGLILDQPINALAPKEQGPPLPI
jgi:tetratricopeptide (TPR) repeat protein